ncbi:hypothetical protein ZWY2020_003118 [Hordeum vulgare]|nr:hypothetical protein ZWY2020_003118 [Hordeum vulgare]
MAMSTAFLPPPRAVSSFSFGLSATVSFCHSRSLAATAVSAPPTSVLDVYCGRGDRKTKRGKRFSHSYGNARPVTRRRNRPSTFASSASKEGSV